MIPLFCTEREPRVCKTFWNINPNSNSPRDVYRCQRQRCVRSAVDTQDTLAIPPRRTTDQTPALGVVDLMVRPSVRLYGHLHFFFLDLAPMLIKSHRPNPIHLSPPRMSWSPANQVTDRPSFRHVSCTQESALDATSAAPHPKLDQRQRSPPQGGAL